MKNAKKFILSLGIFLVFALTAGCAQGSLATIKIRAKAYKVNEMLGRGNNLMAAKTMGGVVGKEDFALLRKSGFDHVRLGYKLDETTDATLKYILPPERIAHLRELVDSALAAGLLVVLDPVHNWANGPTFNPPEDYQKLQKIWEQVSVSFSDYDTDKVVFEILNEPHVKEDKKQEITANLIRIGLKAIRNVKGNEDRVVIFAGDGFPTWRALIDAFDKDEVSPNDPYLIGTFHYYDPRSFTNQGKKKYKDTPAEWGSKEDLSRLKSDFDAVFEADKKWAQRHKTEPLPIYVGEFGVNNFADEYNESRPKWLRAVRDTAEERFFSWAHWNMYSNKSTAKGMGPWTEKEIENPQTRYFDKEPLEALTGEK